MAQVLVSNGEDVSKGQALLKYDVRAAEDQKNTLSRQLELEEGRLKDQLKRNTQRQKTLKRNLALRTKILERLNPLQASGAISELQILQELMRMVKLELILL